MSSRRRRGFVVLVAAVLAGGYYLPTAPSGAAPAPPAEVYLVIVDGLGADAATPQRMPRLAAAARGDGSWLAATAVMPTRTNPNHASVLTGTQPAGHGVTGNWYWTGSAGREMADPSLLEVETLFAAIERQRPALVTAAAFAKAKLRQLLVGSDISWRPEHDDVYAARDDETMAGFRALVRTHRPAFAMVALADVDGFGHRYGPGAASYPAAVRHADQLIGALYDDLVAAGRWSRSVVFVTADHGFDALRSGGGGLIEPAAVVAGGAHLVSDGGVAHVYAGPAGSLEATIATARRHAGVAAVYARAPRPDAPPLPVAWRLDHPRTGDVLLVARPGFTFVGGPSDPTRRFRGNHGGPGERQVPLIVVGGHPVLRKAPAGFEPSVIDVAPTIARLLGIEPPRRRDVGPVAAADQGRVLTELIGGQ